MGEISEMGTMDFVVPLCKNNMIIRTTIESIVYNYHPINIYIITNHIIEKFNDSGLETITPNFLYYSLLYDEGKETARKISDIFEHKKTHLKR